MKMIYFTAAAIALTAITACSEKEHYPDIPKDWQGTTDYFLTDDEKGFSTYYKPYVGTVGDPMPFYDPVEGNYKILYLQDYEANAEGTYHPIWAVETENGASYTSLGEIIPCGTINEQDAALGTGCAVYDQTDKLYYIYYTGNKYQPGSADCGQVVMRAVSEDFVNWAKDMSFSLKGPDNGYSRSDFRDPCIFQDENGKWHMLISTVKSGKGTLAEYVSDDLDSWTWNSDFMTMMWDRFYECPDVFKMGGYWYLVYSEKHSAIRKVQYFKGSTIDELKACTANDAGIWPDFREGFLDSRGFYAGKTASDGTDRLIWGWCPTRPGQDNTNVGAAPNEPSWGGALVCHKLIQHEDGTLDCVPVESIVQKYSSNCEVKVMGGDGYSQTESGWSLATDGHILYSRLSTHNYLNFKVKVSSQNDIFAISTVRGSDSEKYYSIVFNPEDNATMRKLNFEERGAEGKGFIEGIDSNKFAWPADGIFNITLISDNSVCTLYVNDAIVWTNRIYDLAKNCWSIDCLSGSVEISDLVIKRY